MSRTVLRPRSLERRLVVALIVPIALTGIVTGAISFAWALKDANEILDGALVQATSLLLRDPAGQPPAATELPGTEPDNDVLVWRYPSHIGRASAGVTSMPLRPPRGLHTIEWRGERWRVLATPVANAHWLVVAQRMQVRDEIAWHSALRGVLPLLVIVPLLVLLVRVVVSRTFGPLRRLAAEVDARPMERALDLPAPDLPEEVAPFVASIRRLVAALSEALAQQRRFVANAAHELRTPVAALSIQAGNLAHVISDAPAQARMTRLRTGIDRLERLLEQLLSMARAQARPAAADARSDVAAVAREAIGDSLPIALAAGIDLGAGRLDADCIVHAEPSDLATVLRNVIGNALKFCPTGASVTVSVERSCPEAGGPDEVVLRVTDTGIGMSPATLAHAFEPFVRGDEARAPGSGLGLSIVEAIARRLAARVELRSNDPAPGLTFEYRQAIAPGVD